MPLFGCNVRLWYFLIILTYFCCFWSSCTPGKQIGKPGAAAESHAIGINPVHGIDDAIAKFVFDKCVEKRICIFPNNIDIE